MDGDVVRLVLLFVYGYLLVYLRFKIIACDPIRRPFADLECRYVAGFVREVTALACPTPSFVADVSASGLCAAHSVRLRTVVAVVNVSAGHLLVLLEAGTVVERAFTIDAVLMGNTVRLARFLVTHP